MTLPETFFSINEQVQLFLISCILGAVFGVVYDAFRAMRLLLPHNSLLVAIEDILFITIYTIAVISFTSAAGRGDFRIYYVFGNILGFTLYLATVGSIVIRIINRLIFIIRWLLKFVWIPCKWILSIFKRLWKMFVVNIYRNYKKTKKITEKHLIKRDEIVYNERKIKKRKGKKTNDQNAETLPPKTQAKRCVQQSNS